MASTESLKLLLALDVQAAGLAALDAVRYGLDGLTESAGMLRPALLGIGLAVGGIAVAAAAIGEGVKAASDWQTTLTEVQNNTTMTAAETDQMRRTIERLASESPASMAQLAQGYMHVANFGFNAAQSQQILTAAMESAVSTGGNVADVANVLAAVMHEFSIPAREAANAMDVMHLAAAQGNMTLEQFTESGGQAMAMAANMGVPLTQAAAAMSALTRHGFDAAMAGTQVKDMIQHIVAPAKATEKELARLSALTGIDLVHDFSEAGLRAKGLSGVLADVQAATHGNSAEILKLIPNIRGGLAAVVLTGTGTKDYEQILKSLNATMAGQSQPTAEAYARSQQTLGFVMGELGNNVKLASIALGDVFLPELTSLAKWVVAAVLPAIRSMGTGMQALRQWVAGAASALQGLGAAVGGALPDLAAQASGVLVYAQALAGTLQPALARLRDAVQGELVPTLLAWGSVMDGVDRPILQSVATTLVEEVLPALTLIGQWVMGQLVPALAQIASTISVTVLPIIQQFGALLSSLFAPAVQQAGTAVLQFTDRVLPRITAVLNNLIIPGVRQLMGTLSFLWKHSWGTISQTVQGAWATIEGIIQIAWAVISGIIYTALDVLSGHWGAAWNDLAAINQGVLDGLETTTRGFGVIFRALWSALMRAWIAAMRAYYGEWLRVGEHLIEGLRHGVEEAAGQVLSTVTGVVQGALNRVKQLLGISSPSRVMAQMGLDTMAGLTQGLQQGGPQSVAALESTLRQMKTAATAQLRQVKTAAHEQAMQLRHGVDAEIKQLREQATAQIKELELQTRWHIEGMRKGARHESRAMRHEVALEAKQLEAEMRQHVTAIRQNTDAQIKQLRLSMQTQLQQMSVQGIQHVKSLQVTSQQALTALQVGGNQQTALLTTGTLAQLDTLRGKAEGIMILLRDHFLSIYGTMHEDAILAGNAIGEGLAAGITMRINQIKDAAIAAAVGAINAAKAALGVRSPSTVFAEIGQQTALGFVQGVQRQTGLVQEALRQLVSPAGGAALGGFGGVPGMVAPAAAVPGASAPGITVVITGNTILNERTVEDLATQVGRVLIQQTRAAYPVMR